MLLEDIGQTSDQGEKQMKRLIVVIVLAMVASGCGAQQKIVKPSAPVSPLKYSDGPAIEGTVMLSLSNVVSPGPCGWYRDTDNHLLMPDKDGVCKLAYDFHFGPDDADCRWVTSADGKTLNVTCTWKPEKEKLK
jgi:hypothetical protein